MGEGRLIPTGHCWWGLSWSEAVWGLGGGSSSPLDPMGVRNETFLSSVSCEPLPGLQDGVPVLRGEDVLGKTPHNTAFPSLFPHLKSQEAGPSRLHHPLWSQEPPWGSAAMDSVKIWCVCQTHQVSKTQRENKKCKTVVYLIDYSNM